jgi:hypothetical protein
MGCCLPLAALPVLSTRLDGLVLAFLGVSSIEDIIGDNIWLHCFFSEVSGFRTGFADQTVHPWMYGAESDPRRRGDEVNPSAALAHDAHMNRH